MNVQLPMHMEKAAFLDWVQGREERYELDRGRVVMMTGGSRARWQITANLFKALDALRCLRALRNPSTLSYQEATIRTTWRRRQAVRFGTQVKPRHRRPARSRYR